MPNTEVYIADERGERLPPGEIGELVVRGANVMRGYWKKPEETAERLRDGEIAGEKVLFTGDQFRMDDEGFLYFVGRTDDIFMCRGEKISPKEIENVLYELDAVGEAAVVGVPDPIDGMAIKATVVPREGFDAHRAASPTPLSRSARELPSAEAHRAQRVPAEDGVGQDQEGPARAGLADAGRENGTRASCVESPAS